jgi:hypothetical protein
MNKPWVLMQLIEAQHHLDEMIKEIKTDDEHDGFPSLSVHLPFVYRHLNCAWNSRDATYTEIDAAFQSKLSESPAWKGFPKELEHQIHDPSQDWYSVRSIFRSDLTEDGQPRRAFEERVVIFRAASLNEALAKGEAEAKRYASEWPLPKMLDHLVAFSLRTDDLNEGEEVWSTIRDLNLTDADYLQRIYPGEGLRKPIADS